MNPPTAGNTSGNLNAKESERPMTSKILPALLLCTAGLASARGWTVSPADTLGANFRDLQVAIDSAAPGDTLWLEHGSWGNVRLEKPLMIIGRQGNVGAMTALRVNLSEGASGSSFWGVDLKLSGPCVAVEIGYSRFFGSGSSFAGTSVCLDGAYIHHSVVGFIPVAKASRFQNVFLAEGALYFGSVQNIFDHVTVQSSNKELDPYGGRIGGIGGLEHIVSNSVLSQTGPKYVDREFAYGEAKAVQYRNSLLWDIDSVESDNSAFGCRFRDSSQDSSVPFATGFHVKSAYAHLSDDGTEPGVFGGRSPLRLVGNEMDLVPLMPLPWLRSVSLDRLRASLTDSVNVRIEAWRSP